MLKQFVKLGRGREGLDLLGFSPNLHPKLLSIILVVDRCPRFSGDASRISNAFTYLFILLILIHLRFKILFNAQEHPVVIITLSLRVRHLPIVLVKVAYYASGSAQIMLKLCSLFKIMLLF